MTNPTRLAAAFESLRMAYGIPSLPEPTGEWRMLIRVLLVGPGPFGSEVDLNNVLESSSLTDPESTRKTSAGELVELLTKIPRGPQKASLLRAVAEWWVTTFGNDACPEWSGDPQAYRQSLRQIRGLGPATVDELLLFVAGLKIFPLDRGTIRVAVRHGWLDLPIEDDESQNFFVRGLHAASVDSRQMSRLLSQVADHHCGREPKCDGCPLQPLLPPNGPLNPDSC